MSNAALKRDETPTARPVDLAHLARQTHGNRDLEREVLHLFVVQSERLIRRLVAGDGVRLELAHALVGSARGIGAFRVADVAAEIERSERQTPGTGALLVPSLADAVGEANAYIRSLV